MATAKKKLEVGRTTDKRRKAFMQKMADHESEFGAFAAVMVAFDGLAELLVIKGLATELELINCIEKTVEKNAEINRARKALHRQMM